MVGAGTTSWRSAAAATRYVLGRRFTGTTPSTSLALSTITRDQSDTLECTSDVLSAGSASCRRSATDHYHQHSRGTTDQLTIQSQFSDSRLDRVEQFQFGPTQRRGLGQDVRGSCLPEAAAMMSCVIGEKTVHRRHLDVVRQRPVIALNCGTTRLCILVADYGRSSSMTITR